jgi:uncharacterized protein (TIGR02246 family)
MTASAFGASHASATDERAVRALYDALLDAWNRRDAAAFAGLFAERGNIVGYDGSPVDGRSAIESHLAAIFADHTPATYVGIVRELRPVGPSVALLRAVVGMVPPTGGDINPERNAVQSLVAAERDGRWQVELFHNTPAAFHGRPDDAAKLTEELRQAHRSRSVR